MDSKQLEHLLLLGNKIKENWNLSVVPGARAIEIILRQMKCMHWIEWMVNGWAEVKSTPVQSVELEQS